MKAVGEAIKASIKKRLDKTPDEVYNIYKDGERDKLLSHPMRTGRVGMCRTTKTTLSYLSYFKDTLIPKVDEIANKFNLPKLNFVLAGGSIRDMLVGVTPKDYDVFVDLDLFEGDYTEAEDAFDIFVAELEGMSGNGTTYLMEPKNANYDGSLLDTPKPDQIRGIRDVYSLGCYSPEASYSFEVIVGRFGGKNPLDIIDGFDYNLVKGGVDIRTGETLLKGEMILGLTTKTAFIPTESAEKRFNRWRNRAFRCNEFKLERTYKAKKALKKATYNTTKWLAQVAQADAVVPQWEHRVDAEQWWPVGHAEQEM